MSRKGIVSKHLVLTQYEDTQPLYPLPGLVLISGEKVESIVILEANFVFDELVSQYPDYLLQDFSDYYVSPGIIDLNVRHEYETLAQLTMSALSGGVTLIALEPGYYSIIQSEDNYYCDVAMIEVISDSYSFNSIPQNTLALKAYLFPPGPQVKSVAHLENVINQSTKFNIPLFIDSTLPDPRMLYMASPLRLENIEDRKVSEINSSGLFAAAFPESMAESDKSSDKSEDESEELPLRSSSLQSGEIKKLTFRTGYGSDEEIENDTKAAPTEFTIIEAKESDESTPCKVKSIKKKIHSHDIYNDLDNRIKASQQNIEDLCIAEKSTYNNSGSTLFGLYLAPKKCNSFNVTVEKSTESDSSEPGSASIYPNPVKKRELFRPAPILIKPEVRPDSSHDYKYHLANYPDHWEIAGLEKIIEYLSPATRVHFQNISSATSLNRVRQIRHKFKYATCEIPATHLYFTSASVNISDTRFKNTPPVRNQGNCNLLWDLLKMKGIDAVSSQHACIETNKKKTGNFQQALNGISSIGFTLQAMWSVLNIPVSSHEQLEHYIIRLAKWLSLYPAQILGVDKDRGSIEVGKNADLFIWKPLEKVSVGRSYAYRETSPFAGLELFGRIHQVFIRGEKVFDGFAVSAGKVIVRS